MQALTMKRLLLFAVFILFIFAAGAALFVLRQKKSAPSANVPSPLPTFDQKRAVGVPMEEGYFTVSFSPASLSFKAGEGGEAEVRLFVIPSEGFSEPVSFKAEDILKDGKSVKSDNLFGVEFSLPALISERYGEGVLMSVSVSGNAGKGRYIVTYSARSSSIQKHYLLPIVVE